MLERSPRFQALINRSRQSVKAGKALSEKIFCEAAAKWAKGQEAAPARVRRPKRKS